MHKSCIPICYDERVIRCNQKIYISYIYIYWILSWVMKRHIMLAFVQKCAKIYSTWNSRRVGISVLQWLPKPLRRVRLPYPAPHFPSNFDRVRRELFIFKTTAKIHIFYIKKNIYRNRLFWNVYFFEITPIQPCNE